MSSMSMRADSLPRSQAGVRYAHSTLRNPGKDQTPDMLPAPAGACSWARRARPGWLTLQPAPFAPCRSRRWMIRRTTTTGSATTSAPSTARSVATRATCGWSIWRDSSPGEQVADIDAMAGPEAAARGLFKAGFYVNDIAALHRRLIGLAGDVDAGISRDDALGAQSFVCRDPEGNRLQVFQRGGGSAPAAPLPRPPPSRR